MQVLKTLLTVLGIMALCSAATSGFAQAHDAAARQRLDRLSRQLTGLPVE